jgi:NADH-ubiquinone oxidoreductase chain 5
MAAPTPVRALVHSSTLVTAGFFLCYYRFGSFTETHLATLGVIRATTLFLASWAALGLRDLKKLVALSTLRQVALLFFRLSLGAKGAAGLHMLSHALFKSTLFIGVGLLLHFRSGGQDFRGTQKAPYAASATPTLGVACFGLVGGCFRAGFFTKDLIVLEAVGTGRLLQAITLALAAAGTFLYS